MTATLAGFARAAVLTRRRLIDRVYRRDSRGRFGSGSGLTGQAALDAVPAKLTPAEGGHYGHTEGAQLDGPPGMGTATALAEYEGVEYVTTNSTLRGHFTRDDPPSEYTLRREAQVAARVTDMDQTMAASRLREDIQVERVVYRGNQTFGTDVWHGDVVNWDDYEHGTDRWDAGERPDLTGLKWKEKAYTSTTADPAISATYGERFKRSSYGLEGEPVVMNIRVPAGTGAVQLSPLAHGPKGPTSEAEILLQRDLTFQVTADHGVGDDGLRRWDVEVVAE